MPAGCWPSSDAAARPLPVCSPTAHARPRHLVLPRFRSAWGTVPATLTPIGSHAASSPSFSERITSISLTRPSFKRGFGFDIGASAGRRNVVTVVSVKSPADGIVRKGDRITKVNNKDITLSDVDAVNALIKKHLHIKLTVARPRTGTGANGTVARVQTEAASNGNGAAIPGQLTGSSTPMAEPSAMITPTRSAPRSAPRSDKGRRKPSTPGSTPGRRAASDRGRTGLRSEVTKKKVSPLKLSLGQASEEDLLKALRARKGQERGKKSAGERTKQAQTELKQARELEEMLIEKALRNADKSWTPVRGNFDMILGPFFAHFSAPYHPRAVWCTL